jgi:hypothetical protein
VELTLKGVVVDGGLSRWEHISAQSLNHKIINSLLPSYFVKIVKLGILRMQNIHFCMSLEVIRLSDGHCGVYVCAVADHSEAYHGKIHRS